jgi:minor curlin subunit
MKIFLLAMTANPFLVLVGAVCVCSATAHAQQRAPSEAPSAEQRLAEDLGLERLPSSAPALGTLQNATTLLQNGAGNTTRIDQQSLSGISNQAYVAQVGAANALGLVQDGSGNNATVVQHGTGNQADLTQQGQGNSSALTQRGDYNRLTGQVISNGTELNIHQEGNNNLVDSEIRRNKQAYTINQYGTGNVLKQVESTSQATPGYSVEMRGSGINLTIEQGKIKP